MCPAFFLSYCFRTFITGADADTTRQFHDKDLTVADFAGAGPADDRFDRFVHEVFVDRNLQLDLAQEISGFLDPAVKLVYALLTAVAEHFGNRDQIHVFLVKLFFDVFQPVGLNYRYNQFHVRHPPWIVFLLSVKWFTLKSCTRVHDAEKDPAP